MKNIIGINLQNFDMTNVISYDYLLGQKGTSAVVPKSIAITTNQAAKDWLEEKGFSDWLGNVTIVEKTI